LTAAGRPPVANPAASGRMLGASMSVELDKPKRRGYLNPAVVIRFAFWTTTLCIVVAVVASILAIWEYTGTDVLWRTVATCAVIGAGTLTFAWINGLFDPRDC